LGTGNWNNRGLDNHIKRPAGVSSASLKKMGMKRIDDIPHPIGCGNTSENMEASLKYPKQCLVNNEHVYDAGIVRHTAKCDWVDSKHHKPAGIPAAKTVQYNNYAALASDKEMEGPGGGKPPSWLLGQQTKRRVKSSYCDNGDPVKHDHVMPHKNRHWPMRRMGPDGNNTVYNNGASKLNWNLTNQQLNSGPLQHHEMSDRDWEALGTRIHVSPLGELSYKLAGKEDMRPACTKEYTKSDRPPTRMTQYMNDSRQLPRFERQLEAPHMFEPLQENPMLKESEDMMCAMYGRGDRTPSAYSQQPPANYFGDGPAPSPDKASFVPSEYTCDPAGELRPAPIPPPQSPGGYADSPGGRSPGGRSPGGWQSPGGSRAEYSRASPSAAEFDRPDARYRGSATSSEINNTRPRRRPASAGDRGGRTPMSARGSDRSYRDRYEGSIASSYYYSESQGGRSQTSRRSKSLDRFAGRQSSRGDRYSDSGGSGGYFQSDPKKRITEQTLNEALRNSRSFNKTPMTDRRSPR